MNTYLFEGGSSGIGAALACELASAGAKLILTATNEDKLNASRERCLKFTKDVLIVKLDITKIDEHQSALNKIIDHYGRVDILVNNAGRYQAALFVESDLSVDKSTFDINVFGPIALTQRVVNYWIANIQHGHIAVTSSVTSVLPAPTGAAYSATKHALDGYYDAIRCELYHRNISVTMIYPGPVATDMFASAHTSEKGN